MESVREGEGQVDVGEVIGVVSTVEDVVVVVALAAGDGDDCGARVVLRAHTVVARSRDGASGDEDELRGLASVQRQLCDTRLIDDLLKAAGLGFKGDTGGLHLDVLIGRTYREMGINGDVVADLEDSCLGESLETLCRHVERVWPNRYVRQGVDS